MKLTKRDFLLGTGATLLSTAAQAADTREVLHRCGVVEMRQGENGKVDMLGWKDMVPNERPAIAPQGRPHFVVTSSFQDKILEVHEMGAKGNYEPRIIWPSVTPDSYKLGGTVHGRVYQIDMRPEWYPSGRLRQKYEDYRRENPGEDLPPLPNGRIPYGHPGNPMGERKIRANWRGRYIASAVLHGTTGYPVELCGVETSGCVRLYNDWIIKLVDEVLGGPNEALRAGVEVILTPQRIARTV